MKRLHPVFLVLLVFLTAGSVGSFTFEVPPGWRDLSPGAPDASFVDVPPEVAARIKQSAPPFFAADVSERSGKFMTNVSGVVKPSSGPLDDEIVQGLSRDLARTGNYTAKDKVLEDWDGISIAKLTGELEIGGRTLAQVIYVIPGDGERAILTFSTTPQALPRYAPIFEASARATHGAIQPKSFFDKTGVRGTVLGFIGAAILLVIIRRAKAKRATS